MKRIKVLGLGMFLSTALLAGCQPPEETEDPVKSERCSATATEYLAFDVNNHASQDKRLKAIDDMIALYTAAEADTATVGAKADAVMALYTSTETSLQAKVLGREDKHFSGDEAKVGQEIDKAILEAIDDLREAGSASDPKLAVKLAKQRFEKAGFYRFLYLSVMEELYEPSYKHYDEAYGYFGSGAANTAAGQKGLSRLASRRDANNGTTLNVELFDMLREGSCTIETALKAKNADTMEFADNADYSKFVQNFDEKLQRVFLYSVGHELVDIAANRSKPNDALVKLVEADGFLVTLEPYFKSASSGAAKYEAISQLRAAIQAAYTRVDAKDTTWVNDFPAEDLLLKLETAFGIDVKA
jgi:hypothetical protein